MANEREIKFFAGQTETTNDKPDIVYLDKIIKVSKAIYMWPLEESDREKAYKFNIWIWSTFIYCSIGIISLFIHIFMNYGNMDRIVDSIDHVTVFASGVFRFMYIYFRGRKYLVFVNLLRKNFICRPLFAKDETNELHGYYEKAKWVIIGYNTPIFLWIGQALALPLIKFTTNVIIDSVNDRLNLTQIPFQPPLFSYFPLDITRMPGAIIFYVFEAYILILMGITYAFVDNFWFMTFFLTIGQLDMIKTSIESLSVNECDVESQQRKKLFYDENEVVNLNKKLKKCLYHHQFIREFIRSADELLNPNVLVDYFHAIISIAFLMLEVTVTLKIGAWGRFAHSFQYLMVSICHMFIFDWIAQELADREEALCDTLYDLPWYKFPSLRDKMLLPMQVCSRPYRISGGRTFWLTLEFFMKTSRMIFSYFTFLLQMRSKGGVEV